MRNVRPIAENELQRVLTFWQCDHRFGLSSIRRSMPEPNSIAIGGRNANADCQPCTRCGKQPEFVTSMLDPRAHRPYVPMPVRRYILDVRKGVKLQAFYSESEMVGKLVRC